MLNKKQIHEIKEHLDKAQNPVFYYDNDVDGLCSFVLLRKYIGRGKGVAVRSYPDLNVQYAKKAQELNADVVFVLDKPVISQEFIDKLGMMHLPVIWVDHHDVKRTTDEKNITVFNPTRNDAKSQEPVTYLI